MIAVIDYGMGNLKSVCKAFESFGAPVELVTKPRELLRAEKAVLPGVGAFNGAMHNLRAAGFIPALEEFAAQSRPLLGLCLGLQLFFEYSYEGGTHKGLGFFKGKAVNFKDAFARKKIRHKVPHIGWNQIHKTRDGARCPLLKGVRSGAFVYFVHSYYVVPEDMSTVALTTDYGIQFASMVATKTVFGIQFHPEKSQKVGLTIIENFIRL